mmetsp:Transcript_3446/g.5737  ORF Transcript_3446/g.5737 Transcript_3446/m.5737 type:complete len:81 (-) Transcript_3446:159-401(-)
MPQGIDPPNAYEKSSMYTKQGHYNGDYDVHGLSSTSTSTDTAVLLTQEWFMCSTNKPEAALPENQNQFHRMRLVTRSRTI